MVSHREKLNQVNEEYKDKVGHAQKEGGDVAVRDSSNSDADDEKVISNDSKNDNSSGRRNAGGNKSLRQHLIWELIMNCLILENPLTHLNQHQLLFH